MPPASVGVVGEQAECDQQDQFFREIGGVEVVAVGGLVDMHGLPGDDGVHVEENPPNQQESKIKHPDARVAFIFLKMREQGECSHHRDQVQEQNDIAAEGVWYLLALEDFEVVPHALIAQPEEHAAERENPEGSRTAAGATRGKRVGQKGGGCHQKQNALNPVANNGQGVTAWYDQRRGGLGQHQECQHENPEFIAQRQADCSAFHSRAQFGQKAITRVTE